MGMPQHRFASVHVVGTNGKSSVAQMTAALLEAHGVSTGAYLSPHVTRWSERIQVRGEEIDGAAFAAAVERTAESVEAVNRTLDEDDAVTQFEAVTAAAFVALAAAGVEVGVIEAGLGGRLDATNVIPSRVCALTSVGLEHTEWLGDTEAEIAAEKLAVLRNHSTLVLGEVSAEVERLADRVAIERGASLVRARPGPKLSLRAAASSVATSPSRSRAPARCTGKSTWTRSSGWPPSSSSPDGSSCARTIRRPSSTRRTTRTAPAPSPTRCPRSRGSGRSSPASRCWRTRTRPMIPRCRR